MIDYKQLYIDALKRWDDDDCDKCVNDPGDAPDKFEQNAIRGIIFKFRQWVKNPACKPDCFDENYKGFVLKEDNL